MLPPSPRLPGPAQQAWWLGRPIHLLETLGRRLGDAFTIDLGRFGRFVFLSDPAEVKEVFQAPPDVLWAGSPNAVLAPIVGRRSVLTSDEDRHLRQRKLLLPPFHGERIQVYRERLEQLAREAVGAWPRHRPVRLDHLLQRVTLSVIVELVFGVREGPRHDRLLALIPPYARAITPLLFVPALGRDLGRWSPGGRVARMGAELDALLAAQIAERRAAPGGDDVLSLLLEARDEEGRALDDRELRDELMTLLFAGHETTATALAWTADLLVHHPGVLARLRDELDGPYLGAVIKEAHRLRPTVPNVVREVRRPVAVGRWSLEPGCVASPAIHLVHRRADLYPDPLAFRPERHLDGAPAPYAWLPFGGGRRRCLGAAFATLEMEVLLREIVRAAPRPGRDRPERPRRRTVTSVPRGGATVVLTA